MEITVERFRDIAATDPSILDDIVDTVTTRAELDQPRAGLPGEAPPEAVPTLLMHIWRFMRPSSTP